MSPMERVMEVLIMMIGNVGAAVISWLVTWFMLMVPYFWMSDHVWTDGELPPIWFFLIFMALALTCATLVSKTTYRLYKRGTVNFLAERIEAQATAKAAQKMQNRYPDLVKYVNKS